MENVCKNENFLFKILPCLLIAMIAVMCLFGSTVCAFDGNNVVISDGFGTEHKIVFDDDILNQFNYITIVRYEWSNYIGNFVVILTNDSNLTITPDVSSSQSNMIIRCSDFYLSSDQSFSNNTEQNMSISSFTQRTDSFNIGGSSSMSIVYSNIDIYDVDNNLVFQAPPQKVEGITIPAIQTAKEIPQRIVETVKIILPIFLAIFGVLLFLSLIKSKNLLHL